LLNNAFYLIDFPGYGFAELPQEKREWVKKMINWYFIKADYRPMKVVLIIDAKVGPTKDDLSILCQLENRGNDIVIVANKIDKIKKTEYEKKFEKINIAVGGVKVVPFSAEKKIGVAELLAEILG